MENYKIYKARLNFGNVNKYVGSIQCKSLNDAKQIVKKQFNLNPYYAVILDENNEVLNNNFLSFLTEHK